MKKGLTKILTFSSLALLALASCNKNDPKATFSASGSGTLSASSTTPVLDKTKLSDTTKIVTFSSTAPKFGFSAAVTTTLQIDVDGDNWANPSSTTLAVKSYSMGFSTNDFNNLLLKLKIAGGSTAKVNVRMQYSLSTAEVVYSNVVSVTVTPFNLTSWVYITGYFSSWQNPGPLEDSLISVTGNGVYTGIINFQGKTGDEEFLVLPAKNWNHKYATTQPQGTANSTVTYDGPNNMTAPGDGYYIVTLDLNQNTITYTKADFYSLIGTAPPGNAWSTDSPMKFINDGTNTWLAANITMKVGEYKVRQDDAWTNSWGPAAAANTLVSSGAVGDGNIQLTTAGNYNISFIMPPTSNATGWLTSTTYSAVKQ
jgi:hypothetical protein